MPIYKSNANLRIANRLRRYDANLRILCQSTNTYWRNWHTIRIALASCGRKPAGFTLLETIVALAIIAAAMSGPITLATRGILSAKFAKSRLVSANLSQEGLELVRKVRDDNILAKRAWDFGIDVGDRQADVVTSGLSASSGAPLKRDTTSGLYNYTSGNTTLYVRRINITKSVANQMVVLSQVTWTEGGLPKTMTLQEILYNWK